MRGGGGLFPSPTVAEKSPTAIPKRCWTLEYCCELEFSSTFMEQWTLDARGVLCSKFLAAKYSNQHGQYLGPSPIWDQVQIWDFTYNVPPLFSIILR